MKTLFLTIISLLFFKVAFPQITFQKTYTGGNGSEGYSVQETTDEGYIIVGKASEVLTPWDEAIYVIKTDKKGDVIWSKFLGESYDVAYSVQQTSDEGFIIAGSTLNYGAGNWDVYLIKLDFDGNIAWTKTIGGNEDDRCYSIRQTGDGGFILVGTTSSFDVGYYDVYLIKTDSIGNTVWSKTFGGTGGDYAFSVQETRDNGFIITGNTQSFGPDLSTDVYLIKTDNLGNALWSKTYGSSNNDIGTTVTQTNDNGYIIVGSTEGFLSYPKSDFYVIKTDEVGNTLWSKTYGGESYDIATSVCQTVDGGFIISGNTNRNEDGVFNCYLIKTDAKGNVAWTNTFGRANYNFDGYKVQQTVDGGYIVAGTTYSYDEPSGVIYLVKTDALGNTGCNNEEVNTIVNNPETQEMNPNTQESTVTPSESMPVTISINGLDIPNTICYNELVVVNSLFVYPNPIENEIIVAGTGKNGELKIYTLSGQLVLHQETFVLETIVNTANLLTGFYLLNYQDADKKANIKLIKL